MDLYNQAFEEALDQNFLNEEKWSSYKNEISETKKCLKEFLKFPQHDIMVPLGKKAFIRGKLIHTNDVIVAHDTNYFSLVSNSQADEIMQSRSKKADDRLKAIEDERNLFQGKLDVNKKEDVFSEREIIEEYNEEAEAEWRIKHKESVRKQKQKEAYERHQTPKIDSDVDQLLEKYEMLEELAGELDNLSEDFDDEMLSKLMSGQMKLPDSKKRIAHDAEDQCLDVKSTYILQEYKKNVEPPTPPASDEIKIEGVKKKEKKRRVRFSSEEEVKVIAHEVPQEEEPPTIQINFRHSPGKFHPDPRKAEDDPMFCHPGEINDFVQSQLMASSSAATTTKSILKTKGGKKKKSVNFNAKPEPIDDEFESFLRQQAVMGDVIEHKNESVIDKSQEVQDKPKKVSKFKEMRTKVK